MKYLALLTLLLTSLTFAQEGNTQKAATESLNRFYQTYHHEEGFSALGLTYAVNGKTESAYIGTPSKLSTRAINANSLFQIGSVTKTFVAVLMLKAAANPNYHLDLDEPLTHYLPEYPRWQHISIRQLLNMTSCIPDYVSDTRLIKQFAQYPYLYYPSRFWINQVYAKNLSCETANGFHYSNTNYLLLGLILEKVTGESLAQLMNEEIIKPLALHHTFYQTHLLPSHFLPERVHGYQHESGFSQDFPLNQDVSDDSLSYLGAAGSLVSNSTDIAKFTNHLFKTNDLLSTQELAQMTQFVSAKTGHLFSANPKDPDGYGLGLCISYNPQLHTQYYLYQGMTLGYRMIYAYFPTQKITVVLTANSSFEGQNHLLALLDHIYLQMLANSPAK